MATQDYKPHHSPTNFKNMINFSLVLVIRSVLNAANFNSILSKASSTPNTPNKKHKSSLKSAPPKAYVNNHEHIVLIAQTATKVSKEFDYDSLLEILPLLTEKSAFKSAVDSIHNKLYPKYEQELKHKFESEDNQIEDIDKYVEQCKHFGEKLILDSEMLKEHQGEYFKKESKEANQKSGDARAIEKTHSWEELKDNF